MANRATALRAIASGVVVVLLAGAAPARADDALRRELEDLKRRESESRNPTKLPVWDSSATVWLTTIQAPPGSTARSSGFWNPQMGVRPSRASQSVKTTGSEEHASNGTRSRKLRDRPTECSSLSSVADHIVHRNPW